MPKRYSGQTDDRYHIIHLPRMAREGETGPDLRRASEADSDFGEDGQGGQNGSKEWGGFLQSKLIVLVMMKLMVSTTNRRRGSRKLGPLLLGRRDLFHSTFHHCFLNLPYSALDQ